MERIIDEQLGGHHCRHVGHSYSGAIALRLAHLRTQRLLWLRLYEPVSLHRLPEGNEGLAEIIEIATAARGRVEPGSPAGAARDFVDFWNGLGVFDRIARRHSVSSPQRSPR